MRENNIYICIRNSDDLVSNFDLWNIKMYAVIQFTIPIFSPQAAHINNKWFCSAYFHINVFFSDSRGQNI